MNVLDENLPDHQRQLLRGWRIPAHQIGQDVGRKGLTDPEITPLLHQLSRPTFFTRDDGFYDRSRCHEAYCLVCLAVSEDEAASFIRRFLKHPLFRTFAQRRGAVVRASHTRIHLWRLRATTEQEVGWLIGL